MAGATIRLECCRETRSEICESLCIDGARSAIISTYLATGKLLPATREPAIGKLHQRRKARTGQTLCESLDMFDGLACVMIGRVFFPCQYHIDHMMCSVFLATLTFLQKRIVQDSTYSTLGRTHRAWGQSIGEKITDTVHPTCNHQVILWAKARHSKSSYHGPFQSFSYFSLPIMKAKHFAKIFSYFSLPIMKAKHFAKSLSSLFHCSLTVRRM